MRSTAGSKSLVQDISQMFSGIQMWGAGRPVRAVDLLLQKSLKTLALCGLASWRTAPGLVACGAGNAGGCKMFSLCTTYHSFHAALNQSKWSSVCLLHPTPRHDGSKTMATTLHHSGIVLTLCLSSPDVDASIVQGAKRDSSVKRTAADCCLVHTRWLPVETRQVCRCQVRAESGSLWPMIALPDPDENCLVTLVVVCSCPLSVVEVTTLS